MSYLKKHSFSQSDLDQTGN
uniref:Uncharacterized protein n=1 Tax=Anguilla anguilla TaxID=7936 RepID=A0A0E9QSW8_ANGAN